MVFVYVRNSLFYLICVVFDFRWSIYVFAVGPVLFVNAKSLAVVCVWFRAGGDGAHSFEG